MLEHSLTYYVYRLILIISLHLCVPGFALSEETSIPLPGDTSIPLPGEQQKHETSSSPGLTLPFEFRGYVENTTTVEYLKESEEEILLHAGRSRVNLSGSPNQWFDFGIGLVGTINKGAIDVSLTGYMPDDVQNALLPGVEQVFRYTSQEEELFLQEAFGTLYLDHLHLRVGRHKFYTGTGYAYNPIDLFNVKDPLDPTYETDGQDALLLTLQLPWQSEIQGMIRVDDHVDTTEYLARVTTYCKGWDLALQYTHAHQERVDWGTLNTEDALTRLAQGMPIDTYIRNFRWHLVAAEFSGELLGWGFYGEGGYALIDAEEGKGTLRDANKNHERLLLGIDHTFETQWYVLLEYLRLGQGRTKRRDITLSDRMAYLTGEILSINRDTLFTGLSYPLTDLIDGSLYTIIGLNDSSAILNPWLVYNIRPGISLSLTANIPVGNQKSQVGESGPSGFFRLKYHF